MTMVSGWSAAAINRLHIISRSSQQLPSRFGSGSNIAKDLTYYH